VTTWKAPDAQPVDARGSKVIAVVMAKSAVMRRAGEDRLAYEISARGAQGVAMYRLLPAAEGMDEEGGARGARARERQAPLVVMRRCRSRTGGRQPYSGPMAVTGADITDTAGGTLWRRRHARRHHVSIETLVYAAPEQGRGRARPPTRKMSIGSSPRSLRPQPASSSARGRSNVSKPFTAGALVEGSTGLAAHFPD
jgi:hypothetical protein